jgi:hypothetical protein
MFDSIRTVFRRKEMTKKKTAQEIGAYHAKKIMDIVGAAADPQALFIKWSLSQPVADLLAKHADTHDRPLKMPSADMMTALRNLVGRGESAQALARLDAWLTQHG